LWHMYDALDQKGAEATARCIAFAIDRTLELAFDFLRTVRASLRYVDGRLVEGMDIGCMLDHARLGIWVNRFSNYAEGYTDPRMRYKLVPKRLVKP